MLSLADIARVKYYPELLPDATVQDINAGAGMSQQPLSIRDIAAAANISRTPVLLQLSDVAVGRPAASTVVQRIQADDFLQPDINCSATPDGLPSGGTWPALSRASLDFVNTGAVTENDFPASWAIWVTNLTVAHKYRFLGPGVPLTAEEEEIVSNLRDAHIRNLVADNLRPMFPWEVIRRSNGAFLRRPVAGLFDVAAGDGNGSRTTIVDLAVPKGRVYALAAVSVDSRKAGSVDMNTAIANDVRVHVSRDQVDPDYLVLQTYAWRSATQYTPARVVNFWTPALSNLTVELTARQAVSGIPVQLLIYDFPLSDIDKIRWSAYTGATRRSVDPKLWDQVKAGIF